MTSSSVSSKVVKMMRSIRVSAFGGPEALEVKTDVPIPKPAEDEILINVKAVGVNPVDTYIRAGVYKRLPTLPYTPGDDGAGVVEKVGSKVSKYKPGDRVFVFKTVTGCYAEYATVKESNAHPLSAKLDFKQGATLGVPYFTAYRALMIHAQGKPGQSVLIHGASGSVGNACIQLAKLYGMSVYGTAGSTEGLELIKRLGAQHVFNHKEEGYAKKIMEATDNCGVDIIIEMLANVNLQTDFDLVAVHGTIAVVGSRGNIDITPRLMMGKESKVVGVMLYGSTDKEIQESSSAVVKGCETGLIKPTIAKEYSFDEAPLAHDEVMNNKGATGRRVLVP